MRRLKFIAFAVPLIFAASLTHAQVNSQNESGKFRFYETKQIRGEETYQIDQAPNGALTVKAKTDLPFAEQENKPLVNVTLRAGKDFTPESFTIKGPTLLDIDEDTTVTIQGQQANIQDRGQNNAVAVPTNFFTM